jgi:dTDP-4-dehydrorhamnose 3,5-epimerase
MKVTDTAIPGVMLVETPVFRDARGFFLQTYHTERFAQAGLPPVFLQDNHSYSARQGIVRGMHAQLNRPQGKLVRAVTGEIFDVAVDLRPDSPTFGAWVGEVLSGDNFRQLYVPPGCAHGFFVISDTAHVEYKCTDLYAPEDEIGLVWNDPEVGIRWPGQDAHLNDRDRAWPRLSQLAPRLAPYRGLMG